MEARRIVVWSAAALDVAVGAAFLMTWIAADAFPAWWFTEMAVLALLEIVALFLFLGILFFAVAPPPLLVGSPGPGGEIDAPARDHRLFRVARAVFWALMVGIALLALAREAGLVWPVVWLARAVLGVASFLAGAPAGRAFVALRALGAAIVFLPVMLVGAVTPWPPLGFTPDVVATIDLPGSGELVDEPHNVFVFGTLFFFALAAFALVAERNRWHLLLDQRTPSPPSEPTSEIQADSPPSPPG